MLDSIVLAMLLDSVVPPPLLNPHCRLVPGRALGALRCWLPALERLWRLLLAP